MPAVTFFDGEREVHREDIAVADDDTVLEVRRVKHLVVEVAHGGTSGFGEEVGKAHSVGDDEHSRIVHGSGDRGAMDMNLIKLWEIGKDREGWQSMGSQRVRHNLSTEQQHGDCISFVLLL